MIGKAKRNSKGWGGEHKILTRREGIPCQLLFLFKRMLRTPAPPSSKGTFSCVKHASDRTCKHPWRTHSNALIIGSNQMNYRWPVWWIIQRYILSSDINVTFFLSALHHEYLCFNVSIRGIYPPLIRSYVIFRIKLHKLQASFFPWVVAKASIKASLQD